MNSFGFGLQINQMFPGWTIRAGLSGLYTGSRKDVTFRESMTRTTPALIAANDSYGSFWSDPRSPGRLLVVAAIFHLVVTISVYALGRSAALPGTFDANGIATSFASDGTSYREQAAKLADELAQGQIRNWLSDRSLLHIKLYSISFALLGPWFGSNILSAEPPNALCYLAILVLVFNLGQEVFNRRVGLISAATVALWPTFLLHTTQLLKDPLFVVGLLAFILVIVRLLNRSFSWPKAILTGALGAFLAVFIWFARESMEELLLAIMVLAAGVMILKQFWERDFQKANLVALAVMSVATVGITLIDAKSPTRQAPGGFAGMIDRQNPLSDELAALEALQSQSRNPIVWVAAHVGRARVGFVIEFPNAGSNIDSHVHLTTAADVIRYVPRAAAIGFFAPFPNMWLTSGSQVGSAGRLLSGIETLMMYLVEGLAIVGLWSAGRGQRRYSAWLLLLIAATGMILLGLVVVNIGTLYRLRYVFLILLVLLATEGAGHVIAWFKKKRSVSTAIVVDA